MKPHVSPAATRRAGATAAGLVVLTGLLGACGGIADDAPRDASVAEFCTTFNDGDLTAEKTAEKLAEVGTPTGISASERHGFELWVDGLHKEGDTPNREITSVEIPKDDVADGKAFVDWAGKTCDAAAATPSEPPTTTPAEPSSSAS